MRTSARRVLGMAIFAIALTGMLAACGGGDTIAVLSGSGDGTESFRLLQATDVHLAFSVSNDGTVPCVALYGVRVNPRGRGGQGPTVAPSSSDTQEGGMHLSAGDWLMDFQTKTEDGARTNLLECHWRMTLTTSGDHYPDVPKTGCLRPGTATFPAGPFCAPGDASPSMDVMDAP